MIALLASVGIEEPYYLVADRYYLYRKMVRALLVYVFGAFYYHFWMKWMKPVKRRNGNRYLHIMSWSTEEARVR